LIISEVSPGSRNAGQAAGVEFINENGGGPGVRLRKPPKHSDQNRGAAFLQNEPNLLRRACDTAGLKFIGRTAADPACAFESRSFLRNEPNLVSS
jgi:hypothetical protein